MSGIVFNEGIKEFEINNDPNRILRFNPSDVGLVDRYYTCIEKMKEELKNVDDIKIDENGDPMDSFEESAKTIHHVNDVLRSNFDEVFYEGAADVVFGKQNPLAFAGGQTIYENFMEALKGILEPEIEKEREKSEKNIRKYKEQYKKYVNKVTE